MSWGLQSIQLLWKQAEDGGDLEAQTALRETYGLTFSTKCDSCWILRQIYVLYDDNPFRPKGYPYCKHALNAKKECAWCQYVSCLMSQLGIQKARQKYAYSEKSSDIFNWLNCLALWTHNYIAACIIRLILIQAMCVFMSFNVWLGLLNKTNNMITDNPSVSPETVIIG